MSVWAAAQQLTTTMATNFAGPTAENVMAMVR